MKITDPEVIKNGEKDLIASVQEDLDPGTVREILKDRLATAQVEPKGGQLVVHNNDVAFRLDFQVNLSGSLLFDRDGNLIEEVPPVDTAGTPEPPAQAQGEPAEHNLMEPDPAPGTAQDPAAQSPATEEGAQAPAPIDEEAEDTPEDMERDIEEEDLTQDLADYELEDEAFEEDSLADEDLMTALDESSEDPTGPPDGDLNADLDSVLESDLETDLTENLTKELEAESLSSDDPLAGDDGDSGEPGDLDEDINDLLKESRDFWAQKKNPNPLGYMTMPPLNIDELNEIMDNDRELIQECFDDFMADYPGLMARLKSAVQAMDFQELDHTAHTLKGMLSYLAARPAAQSAQTLEAAGRQRDPEGLDEKRVDLESHCQQLVKYIQTLPI